MPEAEAVRPDLGLRNLRADCANCVGLCCVAPAFVASADFAITKPAGRACPNLSPDFRCGIHAELRPRGFPGCTVYDCFGAGQKVSQAIFNGRDWRGSPAIAPQMFAVFSVVRELQEHLWFVTQALAMADAHPVHDELERVLVETERLTLGRPDVLARVDAGERWLVVNRLLVRASELVRGGSGPDLRGADLMGQDLRGTGSPRTGSMPRGSMRTGSMPRGSMPRGSMRTGSMRTGSRGTGLRGANLRGAYLIGADLRGMDLNAADLIGADLRAARLAGADLSQSLFLTQAQVNAALGDAMTGLPPYLTRPSHWGG